MTSRRVQKAAQAVREVVSMAILTDINDPRVQGVTVTRVEVMPDMRQARVHVSVMGNDTKQRLCMQGLKSAAGYLQSKVASRIDTRYTPRLEFVLDMGVKKSIEMAEILSRVLPDTRAAVDNSVPPAPDADGSANHEDGAGDQYEADDEYDDGRDKNHEAT